jgi:DNA polymerase-3 subunit delta
MILKSFETKNLNIDKNKIVLFYGINHGAKENEILKLLDQKNILPIRYEEKEILDNNEIFYNEVASESLFNDSKIIIINRASDKILKFIEEILDKDLSNISIIINSSNLEKKSKLRSFFEKSKTLICIAFYLDNSETLLEIANNYLKKEKILLSQSNMNLIVNKCNGDRGILIRELDKIIFFSANGKKINDSVILKLVNLIENFSVSELVDNCLAKNKRKTLNILNENNYDNEDCVLIVRTFLNKSKKILGLLQLYEKNNNLNQTILNAKPPIFWKDKEIIKHQISKWSSDKIKKLIFEINDLELQIKKNNSSPINLVSNFILSNVSRVNNNL